MTFSFHMCDAEPKRTRDTLRSTKKNLNFPYGFLHFDILRERIQSLGPVSIFSKYNPHPAEGLYDRRYPIDRYNCDIVMEHLRLS